MTRDDVLECFDPGFLTICHHTLIALPIGMSVSAAAVASNQAAAGALARSRYVSPVASMAQMMRAVLAANATMTTL